MLTYGISSLLKSIGLRRPINIHLARLRTSGLSRLQLEQCRLLYNQIPTKDYQKTTDAFLKALEENKAALKQENFVGYCLRNGDFPFMTLLF